jgi:hypothetical protein
MAEVRYFERNNPFAIDTNGRVWCANFPGTVNIDHWIYLGNAVQNINDVTNGNGICMYLASDGHQYLFIFRNGGIDYLNINNGVWVAEWNPATGATAAGTQTLNTTFSTNNPHEALVGINDNTMYIADARYVASLFEKPGQNFDPINTATFSWAKQALASPLPGGDVAQCLTELGNKLLIGGNKNAIYPWDRISSGVSNVILISENNVSRMITVNTNTYAFAGKRGRIYVTNGSQAQLYSKIPDHLSGSIEPVFNWKGCAYNKNQLYFGVEATNNSGTALTAYQGLWAIDITTNALRTPVLQSTDATVVNVFADTSGTAGYALYVAWKVGSTVGVDASTSLPYTTYRSYIITDLLPIGQFLTKRTLTNVEFKLSAPLKTNEGIRISGRTNLTNAWTVFGENTIAGTIGDTFILSSDSNNILEQMQWFQLKVEFKGTSSTPSFNRLTELRLR